MEQAHFHPNDKLTITVNGNELILKKVVQTKAAAFDEFFKEYNGDWRCVELNNGDAIGKEVIE
jgi:antitoxin component of MazEF toxin-antitoxin module